MQPRTGSRFTIGHTLVVCLFLGFSVLVLGGLGIWRSRAPIPERVVGPDGSTLFAAADIHGGQAVYQKHGLMDWGSVLGHGTYYGADFTAEALHLRVETMRDRVAHERAGCSYAELDAGEQAAVAALVVGELRRNTYDAASGTLTISANERAAFEALESRLRERFVAGERQRGIVAGTIDSSDVEGDGRWIAAGDPVRKLAGFVWWTSWLAAAERPGTQASYTLNWPHDKGAGNEPSSGAMLWSGVSIAVMLGVLSLILLAWFRGKYEMEPAYAQGKFPRIVLDWLPVHPSQRKAIKFFVTASALFLVQTLLGGYLAHYYVEGDAFYGLDVARWLPFTIAKTWHLQLAIFWIATAWMGMGLYVAPIVGGGEPKRQGLLVDVLFGAVVAVAVGSLAGEYLGVRGMLGKWWWWLGHSGWELIELGYLWKALLAVGFALWLVLIWRAVRGALSAERGTWGLARLFLASAVAIPAMFGAAFLITPGTHLTMADYWRWWVVHLWVEGMFEVFAVVVLGLLMVQIGLVTRSSAVRALKFQLAILLGSGIVGIGHHYYWIGAPSPWIALGSVFSALEVIPLSLLAVEAVEHWHVIRRGGTDFPYKHVFLFLTAVAFWNLIGAGVLGFLINLPIVNYYEHGSFLTANHGHAATMGVFGMLAIALALYCTRNVAKERAWSGKLFTLSFWGLNVGLAGMCAITLLPVGVLQMLRSAEQGFWAARSFEFYREPTIHTLLWLRMLPDSIFIVLGVVPLVVGLFRAWFEMRPVTPIEPSAPAKLARVRESREPEVVSASANNALSQE